MAVSSRPTSASAPAKTAVLEVTRSDNGDATYRLLIDGKEVKLSDHVAKLDDASPWPAEPTMPHSPSSEADMTLFSSSTRQEGQRSSSILKPLRAIRKAALSPRTPTLWRSSAS